MFPMNVTSTATATVQGIPPLTSLSELILIVLFGIPVAIQLWRIFFVKPKLAIEYVRHSNRYAPALNTITPDGKDTGIVRKYLKVDVVNTGRATARNCTATLELLGWEPENTRHAAYDLGPVILLWDSGQLSENIVAKGGRKLVHVVFSDSRTTNHEGDYRAFYSTQEGIRNPSFFRAQDSLGTGRFEVRLSIVAEGGHSAKRRYRIITTGAWQELDMEELAD